MSNKRKSGATQTDAILEPLPDDGPVKPQVIDATAEILPDDALPQSEPESPRQESLAPDPVGVPSPVGPRKNRSWSLPLAALLAGAVGGGWFYRDVMSSYFPSDQVSALQSRNAELQSSISQLATETGALKSAVNDISSGLQTVQQTAQTVQQSSATLTTNLKSADARVAKLSADMTAITKRIDQMQTDLTSGAAAVAPGGTDASALQSLSQRVARLEAELASLQTTKSTVSSDMANMAALNKRANAGEPFSAELSEVSHLLEPEDMRLLDQSASSGLESASSLLARLSILAPVSSAPSTPLSEERGWFENIFSDFITVTPVGERDWNSILEQAIATGKAGGLTAAIASLDAVERDGTLPAAIGAWREKARQRVTLDAVLQRLSTRVMQASGG